MKKKYIQPEIIFEPLESEDSIALTSVENESIGAGNEAGNMGTAGEGTGTGVNDDELEGGEGNSLDLQFF